MNPQENEETIARRVQALGAYKILDSPRDPEYEKLTQIASEICRTPIAVLSFVDVKRQWFKSAIGVDATETPISQSFCAHAIQKPDEVFEVADAKLDNRFSQNPLVLDKPNIRYYAGAPLVTPGGVPVGTICVQDRRPRQLNSLELKSLQCLAEWAISYLEKRREIHNSLALPNVSNRPAFRLLHCPSCGEELPLDPNN